MCKAIMETCLTCNGTKKVSVEDKCWDCHGTGFAYEKREEKCDACYGTGNFVKKHKRGGHSVVRCIRCKGTGTRIVWEMSQSKCMWCYGTGKFWKNKVCPDCKGKGATKINGLDNFWPEDAEKKLQLA